ncbi:MAG: V-type ATP synthase subunit E [Candidatus Bathyarchaeia archaeon]
MNIKDGLLAIANEVLGDVQKEAEAIILDAENEAKEALKATKEQANENYLTLMNQATLKAEGDRRKVASVTELEMRNRLLQTKEDLVDAAFEKALIKLKDFVTTEKYRGYLIGLIDEVAERIGHKNLLVQVNSKDNAWLTQDILNRLSKKSHCELRLSDQPEEYIGGCKIQTVDGKITYDSTIDNRLQELKPALRVEVAKILFGQEV